MTFLTSFGSLNFLSSPIDTLTQFFRGKDAANTKPEYAVNLQEVSVTASRTYGYKSFTRDYQNLASQQSVSMEEFLNLYDAEKEKLNNIPEYHKLLKKRYDFASKISTLSLSYNRADVSVYKWQTKLDEFEEKLAPLYRERDGLLTARAKAELLTHHGADFSAAMTLDTSAAKAKIPMRDNLAFLPLEEIDAKLQDINAQIDKVKNPRSRGGRRLTSYQRTEELLSRALEERGKAEEKLAREEEKLAVLNEDMKPFELKLKFLEERLFYAMSHMEKEDGKRDLLSEVGFTESSYIAGKDNSKSLNVINPNSGATGWLQFIPTTFSDINVKYGVDQSIRDIRDKGAQFKAFVYNLLEARDEFVDHGLKFNDDSYYYSHFLGSRTARRFVQEVNKTPNASAREILHRILSYDKAEEYLSDNTYVINGVPTGRFYSNGKMRTGRQFLNAMDAVIKTENTFMNTRVYLDHTATPEYKQEQREAWAQQEAELMKPMFHDPATSIQAESSRIYHNTSWISDVMIDDDMQQGKKFS